MVHPLQDSFGKLIARKSTHAHAPKHIHALTVIASIHMHIYYSYIHIYLHSNYGLL